MFGSNTLKYLLLGGQPEASGGPLQERGHLLWWTLGLIQRLKSYNANSFMNTCPVEGRENAVVALVSLSLEKWLRIRCFPLLPNKKPESIMWCGGGAKAA